MPTQSDRPEDGAVDPAGGGLPLSGVAIAQVIDNIDTQGLGRVHLRLPWQPGVETWARVAAPSGGAGTGTYFIPQVNEEVLVAFQHGDVRAAYVLGSLWNGTDRPPSKSLLDPVHRRLIRTPAGHEIELDDLEQSVTVTSSTGQTVVMKPDSVEVATSGGSKVLLETAGSITISAPISITLKAATISLEATQVEIKGDALAKMTSSGICEIQANLVKIN